jgi:hypothetical protein
MIRLGGTDLLRLGEPKRHGTFYAGRTYRPLRGLRKRAGDTADVDRKAVSVQIGSARSSNRKVRDLWAPVLRAGAAD